MPHAYTPLTQPGPSDTEGVIQFQHSIESFQLPFLPFCTSLITICMHSSLKHLTPLKTPFHNNNTYVLPELSGWLTRVLSKTHHNLFLLYLADNISEGDIKGSVLQHNSELLVQLSIFLIDLFVGTYKLSSHARLEAFVIQTKLRRITCLEHPVRLCTKS